MAKNKTPRSMIQVGESQQATEESHSNKFQETKPLAETHKKLAGTGRNFPLVGFTISPEDKEDLASLTLYLSVKRGGVVTKSYLQRELIRIGKKYKEEMR